MLLPTLESSASVLQSLRKGQISIVAVLLYASAEDLCPCFFLDSEDAYRKDRTRLTHRIQRMLTEM